MFSILSKPASINAYSVLDFCFRRLRRIVPIYLFRIFTVLIAVYSFLLSTEFKDIAKDAKLSLLFVSNFMLSRQNSYFNLQSQYLFFLHTWSLSVEMQFYVLVPIVFTLIKCSSKLRLSVGVFLIFNFVSFVSGVLFARTRKLVGTIVVG